MAGQRSQRWGMVAAGVVVVAVIVLRLLQALKQASLFTDLDDVMRLVTTHNLLAGQAFNDSTQLRDNFPFGTSMHWSHLVDLPLAALMWLAAPLGPGVSDTVAQLAWPTLLLLVLLGLSLGVTRRLGGPQTGMVALLVPLLALPVLTEFAPGRVDHHNVQMVLLLGMAWALMDGRRQPAMAALAGLLGAVCLAVGLETLPVVLAAIGLAAAWMVIDPRRNGFAVRNFAGAMFTTALALFVLTTPAADFGSFSCDVLSVPYVAGLAVVAAAFWMFSLVAMALPSWRVRLVTAIVAALIGGGGMAALFPECVGGPYAQLAPVMRDVMFPAIPEAQSWFVRLLATPPFAIALMLPLLVGIGVLSERVLHDRSERRGDWIVLLVLAAAALLVTLMQVRGARLAMVFVLPANAWLLQQAWARFAEGNSLRRALGVIGAALGVAGIVQLAVLLPLQAFAAPVAAGGEVAPELCYRRDSYAELAKLPEGGVMSFDDIGPMVLLYTGQSVVSTGYHRNAEGQADSYAFFSGPPEKARAIARQRVLDYVALCRGYGRSVAFLDRLKTEQGWNWLQPISPPEAPLALFRIIRE